MPVVPMPMFMPSVMMMLGLSHLAPLTLQAPPQLQLQQQHQALQPPPQALLQGPMNPPMFAAPARVQLVPKPKDPPGPRAVDC
jgi:hypothetical protein